MNKIELYLNGISLNESCTPLHIKVNFLIVKWKPSPKKENDYRKIKLHGHTTSTHQPNPVQRSLCIESNLANSGIEMFSFLGKH